MKDSVVGDSAANDGSGGVAKTQGLNLLNWYDEAQAQLTRLREPVASNPSSKSTGRMEVNVERERKSLHTPSTLSSFLKLTQAAFSSFRFLFRFLGVRSWSQWIEFHCRFPRAASNRHASSLT